MSDTPLRPCPSCARHAKSDATVCPFCGAAMVAPVFIPRSDDGPWPVPAYGGPREPLARTPWVLLAIGALVAAALIGALVALLR